MIVIIRIAGMVNMKKDVESTFSRLFLKRKYSCTIIEETDVTKGMLQKIRNFVAYGEIDEKTLNELIEKRGEAISINGKKEKIDVKKTAEYILKNKTMKGSGIKPFFRLHPARGGIDTKNHFPKGVLANHKEKINELIRRML